MSKTPQVWFSWKVVVPAAIFFLIGMIPSFWGLSSYWAFETYGVFLVGGFGLLFLALSQWAAKKDIDAWKYPIPKQAEQWGIPLLMALIAGFLFANFNMDPDPYGDARFIIESINYPPLEWKSRWVSDFLSFRPLDPKGGTQSIYTTVNLLSATFQLSGIKAFKAFNLCFGMLFIGIWTHFVYRHLQRPTDRLHLLLAGLTSSCMLQYFGHFEVYGPPITLSLLFFYLVVEVFENRSKLGKWLLLPVFLLNLKFHITGWLLFPPLLLTFLYPFLVKSDFFKKLYDWKGILLGVWLPMLVLAGLVYVFATHSVHGPRAYTADNLFEAIFLPLDTPEGPPLDRYDLFSFAHLFDFLNILLLWSPVAIATLIGLLIWGKREVDLRKPILLILATGFISYLGAFFLLNPLLGMTSDWDLFSLPTPSLLVLVLLLVKTRKPGGMPLLPSAAAMSLFAISFILVNLYAPTRSKLLENHGIHHYKTYYIGASTHFADALALEKDPQKAEDRLSSIIRRLGPGKADGKDIEYADLLMDLGKMQVEREGYTPISLKRFEDAYAAYNALSPNIYQLIVNHFTLGQYQQALVYCQELVADCYPNCSRANRIAIHTGVMAEQKEPTLGWCRNHLQKFPDDANITRVEEALQSDRPWSEVKSFFKQE